MPVIPTIWEAKAGDYKCKVEYKLCGINTVKDKTCTDRRQYPGLRLLCMKMDGGSRRNF